MPTKRDREYDELPEIPCGIRPKVLLTGNGINLSFEGCVNTDTIIRKEWKKQKESDPLRKDEDPPRELWDLPLPLQVVAATEDHVQDCMTELAEAFRTSCITSEQEALIKDILNARFDAILSTNYSLEFEKSLIPDYSSRKVYSHYKTTNKQTDQQKKLGIFQCTELPDDNHTLLWHIHGTALRKESMVMGQFYYGKLLAEVIARSNAVNAWYRSRITNQKPFKPKSWIDYFLIGDIHIIGFGLDYSESDIWWLLSYKKTNFPDSKVIFYEPRIDHKKELMLQCYGVKMKQELFGYIEFYKKIFGKI